MIAGQLELQMLADLARLRKDMDQAQRVVGNASESMSKAFGAAKAALAALGLGLSVAQLTSWVRGAIETADATTKLGQKIGVAIKDVAGLQLAFKLSGVEVGAMQASMTRLSREVDAGNKSLAMLGISTRDTDGSLRSTKSVLYDVADEFSRMDNGTRKTALAVDLFGKAGADLIPLLNGGSAGLRDMDAMAQQLGLTIDEKTGKSAEQFNDTLALIGMGSQGVATQVAAQLLPTLTNMAGVFLKSMTEGDRLANVANVIASAMKLLYSAGSIVVEVFSTVGKTLGAAGAAIVAVMSGDFKGALEIGRMASQDMGRDWAKTARDIQSVWADTADTTVVQMATIAKATVSSTQTVKDSEAASRAAAAAAKQRARDEEAAAKEVLKAAQDAERERAALAKEEQARELKRLEQAKAAQAAQDARIASADKLLASIKRETEHQQLSSTEREVAVQLLKLEEAGIQRGTAAYDSYAEQIRAAVVDRETVRESIKAAENINAEWSKMTAEIGQGLTDSLFRAFEAGKGFFGTLWSGIKNLFKTTVLRLVMQPVQAGITSAVGGLMAGFGGTAAASSGGGGTSGAQGLLGLMGSAGGMLGNMGSIFTAGMSAGLSGGLSSAGAMMSAGMTGSGVAMGLGAVAPYALAAAAIYKALSHKASHHVGSVVSTSAAGSSTGGSDPHGILSNFRQETDAALRGLSGTAVGSLNSLSTTFGGAANFSALAKFAADGKDASIGSFLLSRGGQTAGLVGPAGDFKRYGVDGEQGFKEFSADVGRLALDAVAAVNMPKWAREQVAKLGSAATIQEFAALADAISATQGALTDLRKGVLPLGGIFTSVAALSGDALHQLTQFAGGIEAFAAQAAGFVRSYYSADEQAAIQAGAVFSALSASGLNLSGLSTREKYRELVESRDLSTEQGRQQLAALLSQAEAFVQISDYLAANGGTLYSLSQMAPANDISGLLVPGTGGSGTTSVGLDSVVTAVTGSNALVVTALERLGESLTGALATVAGNTQRSTEYLRDLYTEGAWSAGA